MDEADKGKNSKERELGDVLAQAARRASDTALVLQAGVGTLAVLVLVLARPSGWLIFASAAMCLGAFGIWGIADREIHERTFHGLPVGVLRAVCVLAMILGGAAFLTLLFKLLFVVLNPMKSIGKAT